MIKRLLCLAALILPAACQTQPEPERRPSPRIVRHERPFTDWLAAEPDCRGRMKRGEWLVCDNQSLNYLHRTLAAQWAAEREGAGRERLHVQRQQLQALLSERAECESAECVAAAYRRYLPPPPAPTPVARPRSIPRAKPHVVRVDYPRGGRWNWRDNGPSCASQIGWSRAAWLARQCRVVNPDGQCGPERSCGVLRTMVREGCWDADRKPGFCRRT